MKKAPVKKKVVKSKKKAKKAKEEKYVDPMDKETPAESARSLFVSGEGEALKEKEEKEKQERQKALDDDQNVQLL